MEIPSDAAASHERRIRTPLMDQPFNIAEASHGLTLHAMLHISTWQRETIDHTITISTSEILTCIIARKSTIKSIVNINIMKMIMRNNIQPQSFNLWARYTQITHYTDKQYKRHTIENIILIKHWCNAFGECNINKDIITYKSIAIWSFVKVNSKCFITRPPRHDHEKHK